MNDAPIQLAGRGKRLGGALLDGLILCAILVPITVFTGVLRRVIAGEPTTFGQQATQGLAALAVWLVLNGPLLARRGQTIGKAAVGTKIVDLQGGLPPFGKLVALRYVVPSAVSSIPIFGGLFAMVNVLFIFGKERRCIHDYLAGTRVINA
jgi:uncharacterized RDD family membrane protein YckC